MNTQSDQDWVCSIRHRVPKIGKKYEDIEYIRLTMNEKTHSTQD